MFMERNNALPKIPVWILDRVTRPQVSQSINSPIRIHQFSKSPQLQRRHLKSLNLQSGKNPSLDFQRIFAKKFKTRPFYSPHPASPLVGPLEHSFTKKKQKTLKKTHKNSLPPIQNPVHRYITVHALVGTKFEEKETEWENSQSEDDEKHLQEYLLKYNL